MSLGDCVQDIRCRTARATGPMVTARIDVLPRMGREVLVHEHVVGAVDSEHPAYKELVHVLVGVVLLRVFRGVRKRYVKSHIRSLPLKAGPKASVDDSPSPWRPRSVGSAGSARASGVWISIALDRVELWRPKPQMDRGDPEA